MQRAVCFLVLAVGAGVMACEGGDVVDPGEGSGVSGVTAPTGERSRALDALVEETGTPWAIETSARFGTPSFVAPVRGKGPRVVTPPAGGARELAGSEAEAVAEATVRFLGDHRDVFAMRAPAAELASIHAAIDELSMTHVRMAQVERGVPVVGGELYAHFDPDGRLTSVQGSYVPGLASLSVAPSISADSARARAIAGAPDRHATDARLVFFALGDGAPALAWEIDVEQPGGAGRWLVTVDAHSGRVLDRMDQLESLRGSGKGVEGDTKTLEYSVDGTIMFLSDVSRGAIVTFDAKSGDDLTKATTVQSTTPTSWDTVGPAAGAAVDAHVYVGMTYDFYDKTFGRKGWDDKNSRMANVVHYAAGLDNAFYSSKDNVILFGDGKDVYRPLAGALDVVAHEYTHAVTYNTSALRYEGQSGALNEAVSDVFGAVVEHAYRPDAKKNWLIGEGFVKAGGALRDMESPGSVSQPQPSHMKEYVNTQQDNGGVHVNSGIVNKAAQLMAAGGTHPVSHVTVTKPIGFDALAAVFYRASLRYFVASSDFALAAKATLEAAADLKLAQDDIDAIDCAWKAVGVVQGACAAPASAPPLDEPGGRAPSGDGTDDDETGSRMPRRVPRSTEAAQPSQPAAQSGCAMSGAMRTSSSLAWLVGVAALASLRRRRARP